LKWAKVRGKADWRLPLGAAAERCAALVERAEGQPHRPARPPTTTGAAPAAKRPPPDRGGSAPGKLRADNLLRNGRIGHYVLFPALAIPLEHT